MKTLEIWRNGPRFKVELIEEDGKKIVRKELLDKNNTWAGNALAKEIAFLRWGETLTDSTLKETLPKIYDYGESDSDLWYQREYTVGNFQNKEPSRFLLKESFFTERISLVLAAYLNRLHQSSDGLPSYLTDCFRTSYSLTNFARCIAWERVTAEFLTDDERWKIKQLIAEKEELFNRNQVKLCHYEFYGTHLLFTSEGRLKVIDWENVGLSNIAHDLVTIYLRGFTNPKWQSTLIRLYRETVGDSELFDFLFKIEVLFQSLGNIRFFLTTTEPLEIAVKDPALTYFRGEVSKSLTALKLSYPH